MSIIHLALSHRRKLCLPCMCHMMSHLSHLHIHLTEKLHERQLPLLLLLMRKFLKKGKISQSPSLTRWYPSSPKAEAFLLFGVWLQTFLPASSKSNNKPSVPWERRGGWARWERGIRHTAHTRGQPVGRENAQRNDRERGRIFCIWKVFSARQQGSSYCESDDEWNRKAKCKVVKKKKKKSAMSSILPSGLEAQGMDLKALGLLPKNLFPPISKCRNQLRGSRRSLTVIHF